MSNDIRYLLYARKSSEEEDRQVQSIPDQYTALLRLTDKDQLNIVERLDEARSAKEPGARPVFASMLERIRKGEANGILCWSTNRLFRNPVDAGEVQWLLQKGIIRSIRTIDREYRPEDNILLLAVEAATANQQIIDLSKNVKRGLHEKARRGWWPTKAKPGYRTVVQVVNGRETSTIETEPSRFPLLRRAWELMMTGAYSVPQVLEELNGWGYRSMPTRKGGGLRPMSRSALFRLFRDPFFAGRFMYGGEWHEGAHELMVSQAEFERVKSLLDRTNHMQPQKHEFAFTGMIRCGACGCLITAERKVKHYRTTGRTVEYVYYHCTGRRGCQQTSVREEYIADRVFSLLHAWKLDQDAVAIAERAIERTEGTGLVVDETIAQQRRATLQQGDKRLNALFVMRENDEITAEEFVQRKRVYQQEIIQINNEISEEATRIQRNAQAIRGAVRFLNAAPLQFDAGTVRERREIASLLAESYVLTLGKLHIRPDPLLQKISTFEPPNLPSDMVGTGTIAPASPIQRRDWDNIRTLIAGPALCFVYETAFAKQTGLADSGGTA